MTEEQAYQRQKEQHRLEVQAYKKWFKYSPFYLKRHPNERKPGDIAYIQQISQKKSDSGNELASVEDIFEKNFKSFNQLISNSDASQQIAKVKQQVKQKVKLN